MQHKHKSNTFAEQKVKAPGGRVVSKFVKRKPSKAKCALCDVKLSGVPRELPIKMKSMPKTHKRPERPYGGVLCSSCMRAKLKVAARQQ